MSFGKEIKNISEKTRDDLGLIQEKIQKKINFIKEEIDKLYAKISVYNKALFFV